jgi:hypothetical protein
MSKQTAVEWLENELARRQSIINSEPDGFVKQTMYANLYLDLFQQAKQMEKEQIMDAYKADLHPCSDEDAEQYYNETYNNEK